MLRDNRDGHDADGGASVNLLEPFQDRAQKQFPSLGLRHVVNGENDDGLDLRLSDPRRGDKLRESSSDIEWIALIEVSEAIGVRRGGGKTFRAEGIKRAD